ncbi:hypothetical protein ACVW06_001692 [Pantoea ananatis]
MRIKTGRVENYQTDWLGSERRNLTTIYASLVELDALKLIN